MWLLLFQLAVPGQVITQPNLALKKPVTASGAVYTSQTPAALTDNDGTTFCHPLASTGTLDYYFEVDLGRVYDIDRIVIRNRSGCCPERLSNYRLELYGDQGGEPEILNWSAVIRGDGSNSGQGGADTITRAQNSTGQFKGRFVRIVNNGGAAYSPQVAEVEVYGVLTPRITQFIADPDAIRAGQSTTLKWNIEGALGASIEPGVGPVNLAAGSAIVTPAGTTSFVLKATNAAGSTLQSLVVGVDIKLLPPQITEFMADNTDGLKDEDGASSDWIELYNPNDFSTSLGGYYLTDDPKQLRGWAFPTVQLPPHAYLVLFASGKDRRNPSSELHTNFKIEAKGSYLALVQADGEVVQQFPVNFPTTDTFPSQTKNVSYGFGRGGVAGFMRPPTPGFTNGLTYTGVVEDTKFSLNRGFYETNVSVAITCDTPNAIIRYTTNFSEPTALQGVLYTGPIAITKTTVLRAAAFRDGWAPTDIDTQTYVYLSNVVSSSVMNAAITRNAAYSNLLRPGLMDLPSVALTTSGTYNGSSETKASIEWLQPDGAPGFHALCGIKQYGGAFTDFAKKSFRLYFRSDYGTSKLRYPLFAGFDHGLAPVSEFNQLELRSGSHDMSMRGFYMSNIFTDDTLLEMGQLNPHGRFVHLYLNGTYWGMFHLRERWDAAMHQSYLGGNKTNYESINGNWNVGGWADPGVPYDGDGSTWEKVKLLRTNYTAVKTLVDVPEYVDYMLMWMFGGSEDEYRCVGPRGSGSGFKFYLNDADGWFCGPAYCASGNRTTRNAPGRNSGDGPGSVFSMLYKGGHPAYRTLLADRIQKAFFNGGALTATQNVNRLALRSKEIERAFVAEAARWNYLTPAQWASRRDDALKNWLPKRSAEVLAQYRTAGFYPTLDAPTVSPPGGTVAPQSELVFTGPKRGVIYYTLDGTDPREPSGEVASSARVFRIGSDELSVVSPGSRWRWYSSAEGLGSNTIVTNTPEWSPNNWKHPAFDDSAWKEGPAEFGYGEGDEATVIPFGPDAIHKWPAAYFRKHFDLASTNGISGLKLRLKRDDGAVVYLNGSEAVRSSMPPGIIDGSTYGLAAADDGQVFNEYPLSPSLLLAGDNTLAVELHQSSANNGDASFDLELLITGPGLQKNNAPAIRLTENTLLKTRAREGSSWSALNEFFFQVNQSPLGPGDLTISQMKVDVEGNKTEFVELKNISTHAINLRGSKFVAGVDFSFATNWNSCLAPGQRMVLVKDLFAFQQLFGTDIPVAGIYAGRLDVSGEKIALSAPDASAIISFAYKTRPPWPLAPAGKNLALVLAHPDFGLDNPAAWRVSSSPDGTPGRSDSTVYAGTPFSDEDNDGLVSFVEYALGANDRDPKSGPGLVTAKLDATGNYILTFQRNLRADDVVWEVEASRNLADWMPATLLSSETHEYGLAQETWGVRATTWPSAFLRLRIRPQ
jgi:hypothetical protein